MYPVTLQLLSPSWAPRRCGHTASGLGCSPLEQLSVLGHATTSNWHGSSFPGSKCPIWPMGAIVLPFFMLFLLIMVSARNPTCGLESCCAWCCPKKDQREAPALENFQSPGLEAYEMREATSSE